MGADEECKGQNEMSKDDMYDIVSKEISCWTTFLSSAPTLFPCFWSYYPR